MLVVESERAWATSMHIKNLYAEPPEGKLRVRMLRRLEKACRGGLRMREIAKEKGDFRLKVESVAYHTYLEGVRGMVQERYEWALGQLGVSFHLFSETCPDSSLMRELRPFLRFCNIQVHSQDVGDGKGVEEVANREFQSWDEENYDNNGEDGEEEEEEVDVRGEVESWLEDMRRSENEEEEEKEENDESTTLSTFNWLDHSIPFPTPEIQEIICQFNPLLRGEVSIKVDVEVSYWRKMVEKGMRDLRQSRGIGPHATIFRHYLIFLKSSLSIHRTFLLLHAHVKNGKRSLSLSSPFPTIPLLVSRFDELIHNLSILSSILLSPPNIVSSLRALQATCRAVRVLLLAEDGVEKGRWEEGNMMYDYSINLIEAEANPSIQEMKTILPSPTNNEPNNNDDDNDVVRNVVLLGGFAGPSSPLLCSFPTCPFISSSHLSLTISSLSLLSNGGLARIKSLQFIQSFSPPSNQQLEELNDDFKPIGEVGEGEAVCVNVSSSHQPSSSLSNHPFSIPPFISPSNNNTNNNSIKMMLPDPVFLDLVNLPFPSFDDDKVVEEEEETSREEEGKKKEKEDKPEEQQSSSLFGWIMGSS